MMNNIKEGAAQAGQRAERFAVSRLLVPGIAAAGTFFGLHEFVSQAGLLDSLQIAGGAALFSSSFAEMMYRGKPHALTAPFALALAAQAGSLYIGHND